MQAAQDSIYYHHAQPGAVIRITGEDAADYLQSQFSNDLKQKDSCHEATPVTYGLLLNRKGKIQADLFVLQLQPTTFLTVSYFCAGDDLLARLEANIIADDVQLEDVSKQFSRWVLLGSGIYDWLASSLQVPVPEKQAIIHGAAFIWKGRHAIVPNLDLLVPAAAGTQCPTVLFPELSTAREISFAELERYRIEAMIPAIPIDLGPDDLPQEGKLEGDAVSFTKGCYLGQEVMARLKAIGSPQRSLFKVSGKQTVPALPQPLYAGNKQVGLLTSGYSGADGCTGLALLKKRECAEGSALSTQPDGPVEFTVVA